MVTVYFLKFSNLIVNSSFYPLIQRAFGEQKNPSCRKPNDSLFLMYNYNNLNYCFCFFPIGEAALYLRTGKISVRTYGLQAESDDIQSNRKIIINLRT